MLLPLFGMAGSCMTYCGNVEVPYPFGIGPSTSCYLQPGFNLTCDTSVNPPRLLLGSSDFQVTHISLDNSMVHVVRRDALITVMSNTERIWVFPEYLGSTKDFTFFFPGEAPFSLSTRNELVVTGCNAQATLFRHPGIIGGCASLCSNSNDTSTSTGLGGSSGGKYCRFNGCCQTHISESTDGMPSKLHFKWFETNDPKDLELFPGYVFIAEEGWFDQHGHRIMQKGLNTTWAEVPILLRWEVLHNHGSSTNVSSHPDCSQEVSTDLCKSKHSHCKSRKRGYSCHCDNDYHGNPYVHNGCKGPTHAILQYLLRICIPFCLH
ncbi:hypothetical protein CFC21_086294 [Triticum aestivum]|uniref:Wall-associated receptor kinase galacturonan-binding domain-containing protein n=2 Tax=Triticum aestivum TaxID=4565 RepID=A0A3B6PFL4_WHEAT|nr:hypothetical protein CFC21_086294 [Triticum aestivum]